MDSFILSQNIGLRDVLIKLYYKATTEDREKQSKREMMMEFYEGKKQHRNPKYTWLPVKEGNV